MRSRLLYITPLALFTGMFAWIHDEPVLACAEWLVFVTSVLYWSDYMNWRRRLLDIVMVQVSVWIHVVRFMQIEHLTEMQNCCILAVYAASAISYGISIVIDTYAIHPLVWGFGSIGNVLLVCACQDSKKMPS